MSRDKFLWQFDDLKSQQCQERHCRWFLEENKCNAFPDGIPPEIAYGDNKHYSPFPGDHGIQYEPG